MRTVTLEVAALKDVKRRARDAFKGSIKMRAPNRDRLLQTNVGHFINVMTTWREDIRPKWRSRRRAERVQIGRIK